MLEYTTHINIERRRDIQKSGGGKGGSWKRRGWEEIL